MIHLYNRMPKINETQMRKMLPASKWMNLTYVRKTKNATIDIKF